MWRSMILIAAVTTVFGPAVAAHAQQRTLGTFGSWTAVVDGSGAKKQCYIGSAPKSSEGKYTKRDPVHVLVTHRPADKVRGEFSVTAGYTYKAGKEVEARIDGRTFKLFSRADNAWAQDSRGDRALVAAMKAGSELIIRGTSSRGTLTTDAYSLAGFTAAMQAIDKACAG